MERGIMTGHLRIFKAAVIEALEASDYGTVCKGVAAEVWSNASYRGIIHDSATAPCHNGGE
jgi:hypothetical protein